MRSKNKIKENNIIPSNNKEEDKNNTQNELDQCDTWFKKIEKFLENNETKVDDTELATEKIID